MYRTSVIYFFHNKGRSIIRQIDTTSQENDVTELVFRLILLNNRNNQFLSMQQLSSFLRMLSNSYTREYQLILSTVVDATILEVT